MAAAVELGESMVVGDVTEVLSGMRSPGLPVGGRPYDISPIDGRFLISKPLAPAETSNITVVLNWSQELERLVPIE